MPIIPTVPIESPIQLGNAMLLQNAVKSYSSAIGKDTMLVQGAGGNVSWKDENKLWIKASGTWLAEAEHKEIFIPLDLKVVRELIRENSTDYSAASLSESTLRPSIETSLHALLPQPIVVHVHAVDVIARAVLRDAKNDLGTRLAGLNWQWIDYVKPGLKLTQQIANTINPEQPPDILILGNHGLVVAGRSVDHVDKLLQQVLAACHTSPRTNLPPSVEMLEKLSVDWGDTNYCIPQHSSYHALSLDPATLMLAHQKWVMYPGHAIFLGAKAFFQNEIPVKKLLGVNRAELPCLVITKSCVVISKDFTPGQHAMLQCYIDVATRIANPTDVQALNEEQISELINWDAEKYRQKISSL